MSEELANLPETIITNAKELAECCAHLAACKTFGLDTEFVGEDTYHPRLCLVQLATADRLILIDPIAVGPIDLFWEQVVNPDNLVIVHGGREEMRLCTLWTGKAPGHLVDLQLAAGLVGLTFPLGHGTLVQQVLGISLRKGETLTEWRTRPLTEQQIRYAFDDVRYLLPIWERLRSKLEHLGRLDWVAEEVTRLSNAVMPEEVVSEKWRKLRGIGGLDRRRLALVRELHTWREAKAVQNNRPARTVVRDDLIVEIARRNPTRSRDLQVIRGLAHRDLDAIMEAVERGRAVPIESCPEPADREIDPPRVLLLTNLLQAVLGDWCLGESVAGSLVASNLDVRMLVRAFVQGQSAPTDSILSSGWRAQHVLPHLQTVLDGKRALYVKRIPGTSPFGYIEREPEA